jgi:hypothetical protein
VKVEIPAEIRAVGFERKFLEREFDTERVVNKDVDLFKFE